MSMSALHRARFRTGLSCIGATALAGALLLGGAVDAGAKGKPGGGGGVSHTAAQTAPIQLGTSGGWGLDLANGYCCGGTLGSLVEKNGTQYVLSNWHVFASDIVSGGNGIVAKTGDAVIQPGLIDVGCFAANAQEVATLVLQSGYPSVSGVDAAIAAVVPGMVSATGDILEVGTPSNETVEAFIGQAVKKSGRTTRLTRSAVSDVYASVSVTYENECAGGTAFTAYYTDQIIVKNRGSKFLNSGDSGSLLLEDVATGPRAVGLLFAGSSLTAVANPIGDVLAYLGGATMVGVPAAGSPPAGASVELQAAVGRARAAQLRHAGTLEQVPDAVGHAIGIGPDGRVAIKVLVAADSPRARARAPRSLDGVPVVVEAVGRIVAY
jgi:hypothetical protein